MVDVSILIGALLYKILDFIESEVNEIPPDLTCTERPQQWHKPRSNSSKDELVLLDELLFHIHFAGRFGLNCANSRHDHTTNLSNVKRKNEPFLKLLLSTTKT